MKKRYDKCKRTRRLTAKVKWICSLPANGNESNVNDKQYRESGRYSCRFASITSTDSHLVRIDSSISLNATNTICDFIAWFIDWNKKRRNNNNINCVIWFRFATIHDTAFYIGNDSLETLDLQFSLALSTVDLWTSWTNPDSRLFDSFSVSTFPKTQKVLRNDVSHFDIFLFHFFFLASFFTFEQGKLRVYVSSICTSRQLSDVATVDGYVMHAHNFSFFFVLHKLNAMQKNRRCRLIRIGEAQNQDVIDCISFSW